MKDEQKLPAEAFGSTVGLGLPAIDEDDRQFLHYNPNTSDIVEWVQRYAQKAVAAERERWTAPRQIAIKGDIWRVRFLEDGHTEVVWMGPNL